MIHRAWLPTWIAASALVAVTTPGSVHAHALGAACKLKGDKVHVEAYFEDDTPAQQALVRVLDGEQREVVKGQTDAKGTWSFAAPPPGRYQVVIDAGAGHREVQTITIPRRAGTASSETPSSAISDAPTREEFTNFPWARVALGVGTIAILAFAFVLSRKTTRDVSGGDR